MMSLTKNWPTILVTGAPGWLASRLVESVVDGLKPDARFSDGLNTDKVRTLSIAAKGERSDIQHIGCDLRDAQGVANALKGMKDGLVFHIAGIIHPKFAWEFDQINFGGTKNLLDAAEREGVRRVVIMSSNSPFGTNANSNDRFDESSPYHPYMGYGRSKMKMEKYALEMSRKGQMEIVIVRAPWFYGPFQPERQSLFFKMIRAGKVPLVGSGENLRSMAYLENLCQGLLLAACTSKANGQAYWIADRRPYSMNEIIATIETVLEENFNLPCAHKRMRLPDAASEIAYGIDWSLQKLGLYHQKIHVLSEMNKNIACTIDKAEKDLGYTPAVDLREGMRRSLAWALEHGHSI